MITVDMGSRYLKAAQFAVTNKKPVLTHFEMISTPAQAMDKSALLDSHLIQKELSALLHQQMKYHNKCKVILGIGGSAIVTRKLNIIRSDHANIRKENIRFEASQHLPFDIEHSQYVTIDLPHMEGDDPNMDSVFLIAMQSKDLNKYNLCTHDSSIRTDVVYPSLLSLQYVLSASYMKLENSDYILVLDIGFQTTGFYVIRNSRVVFSRDLFTGTQSYLQEIQQRLGVTYEEAQNLLDTVCKGESVPNEVMEIIQHHNITVAQEISVGMEYFLNYFNVCISKVCVTGGGRNVPGLQSEISQKMHLDIEDLQVFRSIQTKGFSKKKLADLHSFAGVCVGLALSQTSN